MDSHLKCFECGKDLPAMPGYLGALPGMKMRCNDCAERAQAERPIIPMEMISPERKQITIHKPRPRRAAGELSEEAFEQLLGLPHAA